MTARLGSGRHLLPNSAAPIEVQMRSLPYSFIVKKSSFSSPHRPQQGVSGVYEAISTSCARQANTTEGEGYRKVKRAQLATVRSGRFPVFKSQWPARPRGLRVHAATTVPTLPMCPSDWPLRFRHGCGHVGLLHQLAAGRIAKARQVARCKFFRRAHVVAARGAHAASLAAIS